MTTNEDYQVRASWMSKDDRDRLPGLMFSIAMRYVEQGNGASPAVRECVRVLGNEIPMLMNGIPAEDSEYFYEDAYSNDYESFSYEQWKAITNFAYLYYSYYAKGSRDLYRINTGVVLAGIMVKVQELYDYHTNRPRYSWKPELKIVK